MNCHLCGNEATGRCFSCGQLICAKHGDKNCSSCQNGIVEGDPRPDRVTTKPRALANVAAWWRPQEADDYKPPACYECKGLTRAVCTNCARHYCSQHAGRGHLCKECQESVMVGFYAFGFLLVVVIGLVVWAYLQDPPRP